jgi:hypothetical protein
MRFLYREFADADQAFRPIRLAGQDGKGAGRIAIQGHNFSVATIRLPTVRVVAKDVEISLFDNPCPPSTLRSIPKI